MRIWIKNPLSILAPDCEGGLVTEDGIIRQKLKAGEMPADQDGLSVFDAGRHVVLPGLINTHHHFYQTLTRACPAAINQPLFPWLKSLYPIWAGLNDEMMEKASLLALAELLLSGCTTASDHHYLFPDGLDTAIDIQAAQAARLGIRVALTRGSMSLGEKDGGLPPQSTVQSAEEILRDSERLIRTFHDPSEGSMMTVALAPCSPFSVTTELMRESAALARRHGVRLHTVTSTGRRNTIIFKKDMECCHEI